MRREEIIVIGHRSNALQSPYTHKIAVNACASTKGEGKMWKIARMRLFFSFATRLFKEALLAALLVSTQQKKKG